MADSPLTDNCSVVFRGDIAPGFTLGEVSQGLKDFFNLDEARVNQLFSGRPITIKKNVSREKAEQFKTLLKGMGAMAEIVALENTGAGNPAPTAVAGSAPVSNVEPPVPEGNSDSITIAPPGADVLKPEERSASPQRDIVTDHLSLDSPGADVLKPHERKQPVEVQIDLSHLSVEPADNSDPD
ncbi:MAG: hypothetical protein VR73_07830 [Gammaproteobacteria bacterium BRH_c0]|nr:MAG: hypothetical protein VR73_07830 [Gammaproteobacteria bacterium BRH_c0]